MWVTLAIRWLWESLFAAGQARRRWWLEPCWPNRIGQQALPGRGSWGTRLCVHYSKSGQYNKRHLLARTLEKRYALGWLLHCGFCVFGPILMHNHPLVTFSLASHFQSSSPPAWNNGLFAFSSNLGEFCLWQGIKFSLHWLSCSCYYWPLLIFSAP